MSRIQAIARLNFAGRHPVPSVSSLHLSRTTAHCSAEAHVGNFRCNAARTLRACGMSEMKRTRIGLIRTCSEARQIALLQSRINGRIDAHALDGQRRPACWCGDIETGRHDESELFARSEQPSAAAIMSFPEVAGRRESSATECPAGASARLLSTASAKRVRPRPGRRARHVPLPSGSRRHRALL